MPNPTGLFIFSNQQKLDLPIYEFLFNLNEL